jgi:hypothetical protein
MGALADWCFDVIATRWNLYTRRDLRQPYVSVLTARAPGDVTVKASSAET